MKDDATLTPRALNRALLARQMLLRRAAITPADALTHLVGLQAQAPNDPYVALWSRLEDFDPRALSGLLENRTAVRGALMRGTLHLATADDALALRPLVQGSIERLLAAVAYGRATADVDRARLRKIGSAAVNARPMTLAELRPVLARHWPQHDAVALSWAFHYLTPLVQVPPRGLWGRGGAAKITTLTHWTGRPLVRRPDVAAVMRRYLAAFGPASVADAQGWSGLRRLAPVFEALAPELVTFRDEAGRLLYDLADAPRPDPATPVPPRFLPVFDNAILGFASRERIMRPGVGPERPVPQSVQVSTFLVDGFAAGFWKIVAEKDTARLLLAPFRPLAARDARALSAEGRRLLRFAAGVPGEVTFGDVY